MELCGYHEGGCRGGDGAGNLNWIIIESVNFDVKQKLTKADDMLKNEFFGRKKKLGYAIYRKYPGKQTLESLQKS